MKKLKPAERLIVAADFNPGDYKSPEEVLQALYTLLRQLEGTGVVIKVNSLLRYAGYGLIKELHDMGLKVFADLKLTDIPKTLQYDGAFLRHFRPDLLTAMCSSGEKSLAALQKAVGPQAEVLGVTVLTSLSVGECKMIHQDDPGLVACELAKLAQRAKIGGLILSPSELTKVSIKLAKTSTSHRMTLNCPGIRPAWHIDSNDDQDPDRIMTPAKAILAGADRLVMGRPITQHDNPLEAVEMTLREIEEALASKE